MEWDTHYIIFTRHIFQYGWPAKLTYAHRIARVWSGVVKEQHVSWLLLSIINLSAQLLSPTVAAVDTKRGYVWVLSTAGARHSKSMVYRITRCPLPRPNTGMQKYPTGVPTWYTLWQHRMLEQGLWVLVVGIV